MCCERGEATVGDVNTVLTTLRILETKGYVKHRAAGRAFVYSAKVGRDEARAGVIDYVVSRFFDNSPHALMLTLLETESLDAGEVERVRALLDRTKDQRRP